ncbi:MAG: hypothetical protein ACT4PU_08615 [Planctomycetota bacterium]
MNLRKILSTSSLALALVFTACATRTSVAEESSVGFDANAKAADCCKQTTECTAEKKAACEAAKKECAGEQKACTGTAEKPNG